MAKKHTQYIRSFWFCLSLLSMVLLLAACTDTSAGSSYGSTSNTTSSSTTAASASTSNASGGYGKYGNGGGKTTPTTAVTGPTQTVTITTTNGSFGFSPTMITVAVGTTVVWNNATGAPHTVTSDDGKTFDSGIHTPINPNESFSFKFTTPGTYAYHCQIHPFMKATIVVK